MLVISSSSSRPMPMTLSSCSSSSLALARFLAAYCRRAFTAVGLLEYDSTVAAAAASLICTRYTGCSPARPT